MHQSLLDPRWESYAMWLSDKSRFSWPLACVFVIVDFLRAASSSISSSYFAFSSLIFLSSSRRTDWGRVEQWTEWKHEEEYRIKAWLTSFLSAPPRLRSAPLGLGMASSLAYSVSRFSFCSVEESSFCREIVDDTGWWVTGQRLTTLTDSVDFPPGHGWDRDKSLIRLWRTSTWSQSPVHNWAEAKYPLLIETCKSSSIILGKRT